MKNFITKIKINDKHINLYYYDNYCKKIKYTKQNKEKILIELKNNKKYFLEYKEYLKKFLLYSNLITFLDIVKTILSYTYSNAFIFNLFSIIISFYIVTINLLLNMFLIDQLKGINEIINSIDTSNLPTEIEYLENCKIVNINDYIKRKKLQEKLNQCNFESSNYTLDKNSNKIINQNDYGKILEFKK